MKFPLKKEHIYYNDTQKGFLSDYTNATEIPLQPHPGAFATIRKNHIHEGIDLYCNNGDEVVAIESGIVVNIAHFTGQYIHSPWWEDTKCIMIEGQSGVFNYGELEPLEGIKVGDTIKEGQTIGKIKKVLKEDKGRPMNMLHLELYQAGTREHVISWDLNMTKPDNLLNPTEVLIAILAENKNKFNPK